MAVPSSVIPAGRVGIALGRLGVQGSVGLSEAAPPHGEDQSTEGPRGARCLCGSGSVTLKVEREPQVVGGSVSAESGFLATPLSQRVQRPGPRSLCPSFQLFVFKPVKSGAFLRGTVSASLWSVSVGLN